MPTEGAGSGRDISSRLEKLYDLDELWTTGVLVAANGNTVSAWVDVSGYSKLLISRTQTTGVYAFEVDWSRDGVTADITETVAVTNNTSVEKPVAMKFARLRVRNTDGVNAFTVHRTTVYGR